MLNWDNDNTESGLEALRHIECDRAKAGLPILNLSMINPDLAPARVLIDKLVETTLKTRNHRYSVSKGVLRLREAFQDMYQNRFGVDLDIATELCVCFGTKDAIFHTLMCALSPGDLIMLPKPSYPVHRYAAELNQLKTCYFEVRQNEAEMLDDIRQGIQSQPVKSLLVNFPNNPTGISISAEFIFKLKDLCRSSGVFLINDFVYGEMGYETLPSSFLTGCDQPKVGTVETYSLSKSYSIPGWRIGLIAGDSDIVSSVSKLKARVDYGIFIPQQLAAAYCLSKEHSIAKDVTEIYKSRAKLFADSLARLDFEVVRPSAGASVWARHKKILSAGGSFEFCKFAFREFGLGMMPGEVFGEEYRDHVRFAMVTPEDRLQSALESLVKCL